MNQETYQKFVGEIQSAFQPAEKLLLDMGASWSKSGGEYDWGVIVLTSQRLVYKGSTLASKSLLAWDLSSVNTIQCVRGLLFERLELNAGGSHYKFATAKGTGQHFVEEVTKAIASSKREGERELKSSGVSLDQLERLASLLDKGLISREEFDREKEKLL